MLVWRIYLLVPGQNTSNMSNAKMGPIWVPFRVLRSRVPDPLYTAGACILNYVNFWSNHWSNKPLFVLSVEEATFYENTQNIIKNPAWDHESRRRYLSHRATDSDKSLLEWSSNSKLLITMHLTWIKGSPGASRTQYVLKSDNGTYSGPIFSSKNATFACAQNGTRSGPISDLGLSETCSPCWSTIDG